jgi:5'-3' exonuclease
MGIMKLYDVIKRHCGKEILLHLKFEQLFGFKIAVDISIFLYKFIKALGDETIVDRPYWVNNFIEFLVTLKKHGVIVICVFDGPSPPIEKKTEQERRRVEFERIKTNKIRVEELLNYIREQIKIDKKKREPIPQDVMEDIQRFTKSKKGPKVDLEDIFSIRAALAKSLERLSKQSLPITEKHKNIAVEIVQSFGFSYILADGEAETVCAQLCLEGIVDGVMSEDTDVLAYGTPLFFSKIDIINETVQCIILEDVLNGMSLNVDEFRDLCILLRCDYNKYYKGEKTQIVGYPPDGRKRKKAIQIGPVHAYTMIQIGRRLEKVEEYLIDSDVLNYHRCRELLSVDFEKRVEPINKRIPDKNRIKKLLKENQCLIKYETVIKFWEPTKCELITQ